MARRAIILENTTADSPGADIEIRVALWADVPVSRQPFYARAGAVSAYRNATNAENTAIASGALAESVQVIPRPAGTTNAQLRNAVEQALTAWQAYVTSFNPWARYGSSFDSATSTWTGVTVA
jgi:hypothetical protein